MGNNRIAVTGGAGFIGSAIVWELNKRGITEIDVVDQRQVEHKWPNLTGLQFADFLDPEDFLTTKRKYAKIFHMGAISSTTAQFNQLYAMNIRYTSKLFEKFAGDSRIVYASSASVYGKREDIPFCVGDPMRPANAYAMSKMINEGQAASYPQDNIVGLRFSNVWGPNEYHKGRMASVVFQKYERMHDPLDAWYKDHGEYRIELFEGNPARDFVYIKDAARMAVDFGYVSVPAGVYNVGSGHMATFDDLIQPLIDGTGIPAVIAYVPIPGEFKKHYQMATRLDMTRTNQVLRTPDWAPSPIVDNIEDYLNYLSPDGHHLHLGEITC